MTMKHKKLKVLSKKIFNEIYTELVLENRFEMLPEPGQFIHILTTATYIRRPLSIAGASENHIKILFQIKGAGTRKLSEVSEGMLLDIIGPLGNSFPPVDGFEKIYLVAGGIGVAPLLFAATKIMEKNKNLKFFYGARTKKDLLVSVLPEGNYKRLLTTDDGSFGEKGSVLHIVEKESIEEKPDVIFSAGPLNMLKKLSAFCRENKIKAYVSLENVMFCGLGVCQGCVIETSDGYKRVCKDGPVFNHEEIRWK